MENTALSHPIFWVFFWALVCVLVVLFFYGLFTVIHNKIKQDEEILSLKKKLEESEKPTEIWCLLRGEKYKGYAARVMVTHDGMEFPPSGRNERVLLPVKELQYVTTLMAPRWQPTQNFIHHNGNTNNSVYEDIILFGAVYYLPK